MPEKKSKCTDFCIVSDNGTSQTHGNELGVFRSILRYILPVL